MNFFEENSLNQIDYIRNEFRKHDHYYEYSDDHRIWQIGFADRNRLLRLLKSIPIDTAKEIINDIAPIETRSEWIRLL